MILLNKGENNVPTKYISALLSVHDSKHVLVCIVSVFFLSYLSENFSDLRSHVFDAPQDVFTMQ